MLRHVITCKGLHGKGCAVQTRGSDLLEKTGLVKVIWHLWRKSSHCTFNGNKASADAS